MKERVEKLRSVPLFGGLSDASLERVLEHATEFEAAPGHVLVQPNLPGQGLFVIEDGTVTVETKERKIELGEGEFFGELALFDRRPRSATVIAAEETETVALGRAEILDIIGRYPEVALAFLGSIGSRLRTADNLLENFSRTLGESDR